MQACEANSGEKSVRKIIKSALTPQAKRYRLRLVKWILPVLLGLACSGPALAQIDSGGGVSPLGGGYNRSSIGSAYATGGSAAGVIEILYPPAPALDPAEDADGNGFPDAWEQEHFGGTGVTANVDSDADGTTNLMEYLAGTDPLSAGSVLRPATQTSGGNLTLSMQTVAGRQYKLWGTPSLGGTWTLLDTVAGTGEPIEWSYAMGQTPKGYFLRVEILIPTDQ